MRQVSAIRPARRSAIAGFCVLVCLVVATGVAWACVPSGGVTGATPASGPAGTVTTVTGEGVDDATTVDIRWEGSSGPVLAQGVPIAGAGPTSPGGFSAQVRIPADAATGVHYLVVVYRDAAGHEVLPTQARYAAFQVTDPAIRLAPAAGPPGTRTTVTGTGFAMGTVNIRWDSPTGRVLSSPTGPTFTRQVTIPSGASGDHAVFAVPGLNSADRSSAVFRLTAPLLPALSVDKVGPTIAAAALRRGNRTRTVSRNGTVRLFCGRFTESGVQGRCGARSVRALRFKVKASGRAVRSVVLRLAAKRFSAAPGRPVMLRFRLSRAGLRLLKGARKARMLGTVEARDASGNPTKTPFRFTLKAPRARAG